MLEQIRVISGSIFFYFPGEKKNFQKYHRAGKHCKIKPIFLSDMRIFVTYCKINPSQKRVLQPNFFTELD